MKNFTLLTLALVLGGILYTSQMYAVEKAFAITVSFEVELSEKEIKVFPNPSDGRFQFTLEYKGPEKVTAKVYDITGKLVKDLSKDLVKENSAFTTHVNMDSPKSGIYFVRVTVGPRVITKKLIVR